MNAIVPGHWERPNLNRIVQLAPAQFKETAWTGDRWAYVHTWTALPSDAISVTSEVPG